MTAPLYCASQIQHFGSQGAVGLETPILDGRRTERALSVWTNGFELLTLPSAVRDWHDLAAIETDHYAEVEAWARAFTGCDAVLFYPALLRNPEAAKLSSDFAPVTFAHSDYAENYEQMIKDPEHPYQRVLAPSMLRANVTSERLSQVERVLTLQLWRNVGPELMDHPLCFCDADSVPRSQLAPIRVEQYGGLETQFDSLALLEPSADTHNVWYCFPQMNSDEVVVFRAFDSDRIADERPFWTPHCAFKDPHSNGTPRHSVEMRAVCLFW